ncbi:hypothetical protein BH18ACI4_BH18ACI4_20540 [soil metagenome]
MLGSNQLLTDETMRERGSLLDGFALRTSNLWRIGLGYTLLWWALLLWASLAPGTFWFTGSIEASPASQVMAACAILTAFFIPFVVYLPVSQTKGHLNSFTSTQSSSPETTRGYWKQVMACWLTTSIPLLSVYVLFALMSFLGFLTKDLITPMILGVSFLIFVLALTLLTSTTSIGLAMSDSRALHLMATTIAFSTVLLPFILSELVTGTRFESHLVRFVQEFGESTAVSIFLLLFSLLVGSFFSWLYRRKQL